MKKTLLTLSICMLPLFTLASTPLNQRTGWFTTVGVGTKLTFLAGSNNVDSWEPSAAGVLTIGKLISPRFAWEFDGFNAYLFRDTKEHLSLVGTSVRWLFPSGDRANFYLKLGVGNYRDKSQSRNDNDIIPYNGVGYSYYINKKLDLGLSYQGLLLLIFDAGVFSADITYHF